MSKELQTVLTKYVQDAITKEITHSLSKFDLTDTVSNHVKQAVKDALSNFNFPSKSISIDAINWENFTLSSSNVIGKYDKFSSTGIEDTASTTQLKIDDDGIIVKEIDAEHGRFEKIAIDSAEVDNLHVTSITQFDKDVSIAGNVTITGVLTAKNIQGIDDIIEGKQTVNINGKAVLSESKLGNTVLESNLRTVGVLKELQVSGESLIADTLYVSPAGRIGINTDEPTHALTLWDEEVQLVIGKHKQDTAIIGTSRNHDLELQAGNKRNVRLRTSGNVEIDNPVLNGKKFTCGNSVPGINGTKGDICWNEQPSVGKPVGWICLGGTQWAKFGVIE